jgi:hypothetical protein
MFAEPFAWGQEWLANFRNDPNDNYIVVMFADLADAYSLPTSMVLKRQKESKITDCAELNGDCPSQVTRLMS